MHKCCVAGEAVVCQARWRGRLLTEEVLNLIQPERTEDCDEEHETGDQAGTCANIWSSDQRGVWWRTCNRWSGWHTCKHQISHMVVTPAWNWCRPMLELWSVQVSQWELVDKKVGSVVSAATSHVDVNNKNVVQLMRSSNLYLDVHQVDLTCNMSQGTGKDSISLFYISIDYGNEAPTKVVKS